MNDDVVNKLERLRSRLNQLPTLQLQPSVETRSISGLNNVASNSSVAGLSVDMVVSNDIFSKTYNGSKKKPRPENAIHLSRLESREKRGKDQGFRPLIGRQDDVFALIG